MTSTYTFEDCTAPTSFDQRDSRKYRRNSSDDASLSYSVNSCSQAGESTDSSFAEIRRVLEEQGDAKALEVYLKRQQHQQSHHHYHHHHHHRDEKSTATDSLVYSMKSMTVDSLAYSTDAGSMATGNDSHLQGAGLVSAGQHSDQSEYGPGFSRSYVNNGGGQRPDDNGTMMTFSPAEHTDSMKLRKQRKRKERSHQRTTNDIHQRPVFRLPTGSESLLSSSSPQKSPPKIKITTGRASHSSPAKRELRESRQGTPQSARTEATSCSNSPPGQLDAATATLEPSQADDQKLHDSCWMFCFSDLFGAMNSKS